MTHLPTFASVQSAKQQLQSHATRTPVLESQALNKYLGRVVRFKAENAQIIGAFKFRGAFNAISRLSKEQLAAGVITYSSGNHGQAVAKAAALLGSHAVVVMPTNAPKIKLAGVKSHGAEVVLYDPAQQNREDVAREIDPNGVRALIPPFNHPDVMSGQGTCALEILEDYPSTEQILVPCGGGGLLSGSILAAQGLQPNCAIYGIEPETADDAAQSLQQGQIVAIDYPDTIADGVRTLALGDLTFAIIKEGVADILTVSEDAIHVALSTLVQHFKQWLEPSAVLGLSALLEDKVPPAKETAIILSGGNADIETITDILNRYPPLTIN